MTLLPKLLFQIDPPFAFLTFNRPEARNAMTWAMYDALVAACEQVDRRIRRCGVFILRGAGGKAFVSGTDISQFQSFREPKDAIEYEKKISVVLGRLERVSETDDHAGRRLCHRRRLRHRRDVRLERRNDGLGDRHSDRAHARQRRVLRHLRAASST